MYLITPGAADQPIGQVLITSSGAGTKFVADLHGLPPGQHGFHVHENGDCGPGPDAAGQMAPGMAAGGHYDPERDRRASRSRGQRPSGRPARPDRPGRTAGGWARPGRPTDQGRLAAQGPGPGPARRRRQLQRHAGRGRRGARIACGIIQ